MESVVEKGESIDKIQDDRKFEVWCNAGPAGMLHIGAESLSIHIGQRILRDVGEQMWHSLSIYADEDAQRNLRIRVLVSNPDWDEPVQIASITSRPHDEQCRTALGCDLNHVSE